MAAFSPIVSTFARMSTQAKPVSACVKVPADAALLPCCRAAVAGAHAHQPINPPTHQLTNSPTHQLNSTHHHHFTQVRVHAITATEEAMRGGQAYMVWLNRNGKARGTQVSLPRRRAVTPPRSMLPCRPPTTTVFPTDHHFHDNPLYPLAACVGNPRESDLRRERVR